MNDYPVFFLNHNEIDKSRWNETVETSLNGMVYAYTWYLDLICPGWNALVTSNYASVFPLTGGKKLGYNYLYPPYFSQQLGLFSKNEITDVDVESFINAIPANYSFIEINLNTANNFSGKDFIVKKNLTHHLNLLRRYDDLRRNYSDNLKRNLRKAGKNDFKINMDGDADELIQLFRHNKGRAVKNLKDKHYQVLSGLISELKKRRMADVWTIESRGKMKAGAVFVKSNDKVIFLFSALNEEARESFAMPFIIDNYIHNHSQQNLIFDFEGSNDQNLARFYKGFGAEEVIYLQIKKNGLPFPLRLLK